MHAHGQSVIEIVGLSGSLRPGSRTRKAVELALQGAAEVGAQTRLLDLNDYNLAYTDVSGEPQEGVLRLRQDVAAAQGIILGTPEYHGSFSGILKHALDFMGFAEFEGKMVGLVGVSGGRMGAVMALNNLRLICRALHAWVVPEQVLLPEVKRQFDEQGNLRDSHLAEALKQVGRQVARFSYLHTSRQARQFLQLWESAPDNPGGGQPASSRSPV